MTWRSTMVAIATAAAIAAGCGSADEQNEYVDEVNASQVDLVDEIRATVSGAAPSTPNEAATVAAELEGIFEGSADEIDAVTPPEEVADLHAQLVGELRQIADRIAKAEDAFRDADAQQAAEAATELQQATNQAQTDLNELIDEINAEFGN